MARRKIKINFTTNSGDNCDIIPKEAINFEIFNTNPVLLLNHKCNEIPIGKVIDIKKSYKGFMFKPIFHKLTDESKYLNFLHKEGCVIQGYPGGYIERDEDGNIKEFKIYEVSICI